jgi:hypothetical protein
MRMLIDAKGEMSRCEQWLSLYVVQEQRIVLYC